MGKAGAPGKKVGVEPGTAVEARGWVARLVSLEVMDAKGTAVGFVESREIVILGVEAVTEPVTVAEAVTEPVTGEATIPDAGDAVVVLGLGLGAEEA